MDHLVPHHSGIAIIWVFFFHGIHDSPHLEFDGSLLFRAGIGLVPDRLVGTKGMDSADVFSEDRNPTFIFNGTHFGSHAHTGRTIHPCCSIYLPLFGLYDL